MKARLSSLYRSFGQYCGTLLTAPSSNQIQFALFGFGALLLTIGMLTQVSAEYTPQATYNDDRIAESVDVILTYITGTFGALVMVSAGIAAIISSAFGQYRAALGLLVVALGSFILRLSSVPGLTTKTFSSIRTTKRKRKLPSSMNTLERTT